MKKTSFFTVAILFLPLFSVACGFEFSLPHARVRNVDEDGYFFVVSPLAEKVDLRGKELVPYVQWSLNPEEGYGRSLLGRRWAIPLFDAYVVQRSEREWRVYQPDGRWQDFKFVKERPVPNSTRKLLILESALGWKGIVDGDCCEFKASCGDGMVFEKGAIVSAVLDGNAFKWVRLRGRLVEVSANGGTIGRLKYKSDGNLSEITFPRSNEVYEVGCTYSIEPSDAIRGEKLISEWKTLSLKKEKGGFAVEMVPSALSQVRVQVSGFPEMVYDKSSGRVVSDAEYAYRVEAGPGGYVKVCAQSKLDGRDYFYSKNPSLNVYETKDEVGTYQRVEKILNSRGEFLKSIYTRTSCGVEVTLMVVYNESFEAFSYRTSFGALMSIAGGAVQSFSKGEEYAGNILKARELFSKGFSRLESSRGRLNVINEHIMLCYNQLKDGDELTWLASFVKEHFESDFNQLKDAGMFGKLSFDEYVSLIAIKALAHPGSKAYQDPAAYVEWLAHENPSAKEFIKRRLKLR